MEERADRLSGGFLDHFAGPCYSSTLGGWWSQPGSDVGGAQQRGGVRGLTVRLPEGPTFFRQIEPILASTAAIEQFAESRGLTTDPIVRGFIAQTRSHRTGPASFTFSYGVTRADVRDLPEAFAGEVLRQATVRFTLVVLTSGRSEAETGRAEKIFIDYVRDTMQRVAVRDLMNQLVQYARTYTARMDNELSTIRIRLASIDRQIADLEKIRLAHSEGSTSAESDIVSVPNVSSQSEGRRFLSPVRQIVALQSRALGTDGQTARHCQSTRGPQSIGLIRRRSARADSDRVESDRASRHRIQRPEPAGAPPGFTGGQPCVRERASGGERSAGMVACPFGRSAAGTR